MSMNQDMDTSLPTFHCADVEHLLDSYLDNEMLPSGRVAFEAHCAHCEECREQLERAQFISRAARLLAAEPIPAAVSFRLRQVLREELGRNVASSSFPLNVVK